MHKEYYITKSDKVSLFKDIKFLIRKLSLDVEYDYVTFTTSSSAFTKEIASSISETRDIPLLDVSESIKKAKWGAVKNELIMMTESGILDGELTRKIKKVIRKNRNKSPNSDVEMKNMSDFSVRELINPFVCKGACPGLVGKKVLIVDDMCRSGSSCSKFADLLSESSGCTHDELVFFM